MTSKITCACCNDSNWKILYNGLTSVYSDQPWSLAECKTCKNIVTQPVPDENLLNDIYKKTYLYPVHLLALGEKKFRAVALARFLSTHYPPGTFKTVFEAGCMYGYLLNELKNEYSVKGIDIGDEAVNHCKSAGLDVQDISLENYLQENKSAFDLIILSHVFEHLLSPSDVLAQLKEKLNPEGKLIVCVPNSNSICRKFFGNFWGWWQVPVHINHFRLSALAEIAKHNGMAIEKVRYKGGDSLMLLLNLINLFGFRSKNSKPGFFQKSIIILFTIFLRYWYFLGNEELTVVLSKK
jgi:SAM-dependent methyltransferase